jgi:hypothetical protein
MHTMLNMQQLRTVSNSNFILYSTTNIKDMNIKIIMRAHSANNCIKCQSFLIKPAD